jgi:hypothetical protein
MTTEAPTGEVVQSWVPPELARQLKRQAQRERRSVSSAIRIAIEDQRRRDAQPERREP